MLLNVISNIAYLFHIYTYVYIYIYLYSHLQRVTIPDAVIIQFVLLNMGMLMLETCRGF